MPKLVKVLNLVKKNLTVEIRRVVKIPDILEMRIMIFCFGKSYNLTTWMDELGSFPAK